MLADLTVRGLLDLTASGEPVPGGGSIAALCGALAAGLTEMVARLTVGRHDNTDLDHEMHRLIERAQSLREELTRSVDRDAEAYTLVMNAYRMPKSTDQEKARRTDAIQGALKEAARVPLAVAESALQVLDLAATAVDKGNKNAVTDGLVGALVARSAVMAAVANIRINLQSITDTTFAQKARSDAESLEKKAAALEETVRSAAAQHLNGDR